MASTCHGFIGFPPLPNYKENIANLLAANALLQPLEPKKHIENPRAPWVFQSNSLSHCPLPSPGTWTSLGQHLGLHVSWSIPYQETLYKQLALRNDKNINDRDFFHRKIHDMNKMKHHISSHETSQNIIFFHFKRRFPWHLFVRFLPILTQSNGLVSFLCNWKW